MMMQSTPAWKGFTARRGVERHPGRSRGLETERSRRADRHLHPTADQLEPRWLLSSGKLLGPDGSPISEQNLFLFVSRQRNRATIDERRLAFETNDGGVVVVTLYGPGNLRGTGITADGALAIVYDETNASSRIDVQTRGGSGRVRLAEVRDADMAIDRLDGVGGNLLGVVNLRRTELIEGGRINLTGGAMVVALGTVKAGSSVHVRTLPTDPTPGLRRPVGTNEGVRLIGQRNGGVEVAEAGLLPPPGAAPAPASLARPGIPVDTNPGPGLRPSLQNQPPGAFTTLDPLSNEFREPGLWLSLREARGGARPTNGPVLTGADLFDQALIDVQGDLLDFRGGTLSGLTLNASGRLDRSVIDQADNLTIQARPIQHVTITRRGPNVNLFSTPRLIVDQLERVVDIGGRNGVTIVSPESLPEEPLNRLS